MSRTPVALVIGAGDATGGAIARRFAREGFDVCITRRQVDKLAPLVSEIESAGGRAHPFGCDARDEEQMVALFDEIERELGDIEVVVFNIGANVRFPITETTGRVYRKVWEMACFSGFLTGREAARVMLPRQRGTIIFTGATASLRGGSGFSARCRAAATACCAPDPAGTGWHDRGASRRGRLSETATAGDRPGRRACAGSGSMTCLPTSSRHPRIVPRPSASGLRTAA